MNSFNPNLLRGSKVVKNTRMLFSSSQQHPFFNPRISAANWHSILEYLVFDGFSLRILCNVSVLFQAFISIFLDLYPEVKRCGENIRRNISTPLQECSYMARVLLSQGQLKELFTRIKLSQIPDLNKHGPSDELIEWCLERGFRMVRFDLLSRLIVENRIDTLIKFFPAHHHGARKFKDDLCKLAAQCGRLDILKFWLNPIIYKYDFVHFQIFIAACHYEFLNIVDWLVEEKDFKFDKEFQLQNAERSSWNDIMSSYIAYLCYKGDASTLAKIFIHALKGSNLRLIHIIIATRYHPNLRGVWTDQDFCDELKENDMLRAVENTHIPLESTMWFLDGGL